MRTHKFEFNMGEIYVDDRKVSQAEIMDIIVAMQNTICRLEDEVVTLYRYSSLRESEAEDMMPCAPSYRNR